MKFNKKSFLIAIFVSIPMILILLNFIFKPFLTYKTYKARTFSKLNKLNNRKKNKVLKHFSNLKKLSTNAAKDKTLLNYFEKSSKTEPNFTTEYNLDAYIVKKYSYFYDILFIDKTGYVFHTFRKEKDYRTNLLNNNFGNNQLTKTLSNKKQNTFIDFANYKPSNEPAAFFCTPIFNNKILSGWIVFQCAINRLNTILTYRKNNHDTLETYLVNSKKLMLTDSKFIEDSTILKLTINSADLKNKLNKKQGNRILSDYRGKRVFSSYQIFDVFNQDWIIISEIDEEEVVTDYFKLKKRFIYKKILEESFKNSKHKNNILKTTNIKAFDSKVDMNEYKKAGPGEIIKTFGVSYCTAIAIQYPSQFGYLAHISPIDVIYVTNPLVKLFLGDNKSNYLDQIIERIKYYNVSNHNFKDLRYYIVSTHYSSFKNIIRKLNKNNVFLSNIKFLYNPDAISANVILDMKTNTVDVEWDYKNNTTRHENEANYKNLQELVKPNLD